jgi:protoporphyrin/coproporphyrin ferrochelatase
MAKRMVLLTNFGGPRSEAEVPLFLRNLVGGEPGPAMLEGVVSRYRAIGGRSPLPAVTEELADLLATRIDSETGVKAAFMYSHPSIEKAIGECYHSGVQKIVFFILSPFYSDRTTGVYVKTAEEYLTHLMDYKPAVTFIHSWYTEPLYIEWWAKEVRKAAESLHDPFFLFSAHSLPVSQRYDLYRSQIEETVRLVAVKAQLSSYALAWQSASPQSEEEWMRPSVEQLLDSLTQRGVNQVIQAPIGFVMDHLETLYDIDIAHKRYAEKLGMSHYRLACPNTDPFFVNALSSILAECLKEPR